MQGSRAEGHEAVSYTHLNYVVGVGAIIVGSMGVAIAGWEALLRSNVPLRGIKDAGSEPAAA